MSTPMLSPDLLICAGEKREKLTLFGREFEIRLISAYDAAVCVTRARELEKRLAAKSVADSATLAHNACLTAMCLYDGFGRVFESGDEALLRLTAEELAHIVSRYAALRLGDFDIDSVTPRRDGASAAEHGAVSAESHPLEGAKGVLPIAQRPCAATHDGRAISVLLPEPFD